MGMLVSVNMGYDNTCGLQPANLGLGFLLDFILREALPQSCQR